MVHLSALLVSAASVATLVAAAAGAGGRKVEVALNTAWRDHHLLLEILYVPPFFEDSAFSDS